MGEPERSKLGFKAVRILRDDLLGKGAYGAVYKARCDRLTCAAKELHEMFFKVPDEETQNHQVIRFENECSLLSELKHPNIVQYLGTYREPGSRTMVLLMELLDTSLHSYIDRHRHSRIPFHLEVDFSHDVALALDYLHARGIQHRDLSCKNILLLGEVRAKVTDFGVSKLRDPAAGYSVQSLCPGTVVYMPPEALLPKPRYSKTFDEFSLGVCMIQLLGRKFPDPTDPYVQHDAGSKESTESIQLSVVPEVKRRRRDIEACDASNPVLPIALSCISNSERERPSADQICELLSMIKNKHSYRESSKRATTSGSVSNTECGDFVFIELEENIEQQFQVKIKSLQHQIDEKERRIADAQQTVLIREQQLKTSAHQLQDLKSKSAEKDRQLVEANRRIRELEREVSRQQIQLQQAREQRKLLSHKTMSLQSMEGRLLETMEASLHRPEAQANPAPKPAQSTTTRARLASAPSCPQARVETNPPLTQQQKSSKLPSTTPNEGPAPHSSSPRSFTSSLTSSFHHKKPILSWSSGKDSPVEFQPQSSTAVGLDKCLYISHCNYNRNEGTVYKYDVASDSWMALPLVNKSEFTIVAVEGSLVAVGGTVTLKRCSSLLGLREKSGGMAEWKKAYPDMPTARAFPSCCVSASNLLVVSGGEVSGESSLRVEVLDLQRRKWETVGSLPFGLGSCTRMFACAAANSDDLFYLGGFDEGSLTNVVFKTNAQALASGGNLHNAPAGVAPLWQTVRELPVAGSCCVFVQGQLLSIGGFNKKSRAYSRAVRAYDSASNSWKEVSSMPREFSRGMAAVVAGADGRERLIVVGGSTASGVSCTVSIANLDT